MLSLTLKIIWVTPMLDIFPAYILVLWQIHFKATNVDNLYCRHEETLKLSLQAFLFHELYLSFVTFIYTCICLKHLEQPYTSKILLLLHLQERLYSHFTGVYIRWTMHTAIVSGLSPNTESPTSKTAWNCQTWFSPSYCAFTLSLFQTLNSQSTTPKTKHGFTITLICMVLPLGRLIEWHHMIG